MEALLQWLPLLQDALMMQLTLSECRNRNTLEKERKKKKEMRKTEKQMDALVM